MKRTIFAALFCTLVLGVAHADDFVMEVRDQTGGLVAQLTSRADAEARVINGVTDLDYIVSCEVVGGRSVATTKRVLTGMRFTARGTSTNSATISFDWDKVDSIKREATAAGDCAVHFLRTSQVASFATTVAISAGGRQLVHTDEAGRRYELARQ